MGRKRSTRLQRNRQNSSASLASPLRRRTRSNAPKLPVEGTPTPLPHLLVRPPKRHPQVTDAGYDPIATPVFSTPREARKRRVSDTPVRRRRVSETPVPPPAKKTSQSPNQGLQTTPESFLRASPVKKRLRTQLYNDQQYGLPSQTSFPKNVVRPRRISDTPLPSVKDTPSSPICNPSLMPDIALGTPQSMRPILNTAGQTPCASKQNRSQRHSEAILRSSDPPESSAKDGETKSSQHGTRSHNLCRNSSAQVQSCSLFASPGLLSAHASLMVESVFSYDDEQSRNRANSDHGVAQTTQRRISFGVTTPQQQTQQQSANTDGTSQFEGVQPLPHERQNKSTAIRLPPSRAPPLIGQNPQAEDQASPRQCQSSPQSSGSSCAIEANDASPARRPSFRKPACVRKVASPADDSNCSWGDDEGSPAPSEVALFQQKKAECKHVAVAERGRSPVIYEQSAPQETDSETVRSEEEEEQERVAKWKSEAVTTQDFAVLKVRSVGQTIEDAVNAANAKADSVEDVVVTQSSVADSNVRSAQTNISGDDCSSTQSPASADRKGVCEGENEKVQEAAVYCRSVLVSIPSGALLSPDGSDR